MRCFIVLTALWMCVWWTDYNIIISLLLTFAQMSPNYMKGVLEQLLEALVSYTDTSGRLVSELFQKLPSKLVKHFTFDFFSLIPICLLGRNFNVNHCVCFSSVYMQQYPDYYAIIKEPIDLRTIAQRIQVCVSHYH